MTPLSPYPPTALDLPVADGRLRALSWGTGTRLILAAHGITATGASWQAVARHLPTDWTLVAVDLRGRGGSAGLPGPYGLHQHAADLLSAAEHLAADGHDAPVLAGHSLGAYVALLAAADRPEAFRRLALIDGGLPLPLPENVDPELAVAGVLGPAFARLRETYPDVEAYFEFWHRHPALAGCWNRDIEDYLRYDLVGPPGELRSGVSEAAVLADGRDVAVSAARFGAALSSLRLPTLLFTAPSGMNGEPPGLLPEPLIEHWRGAARLTVEALAGTNHYSILMNHDAAALIAKRLSAGVDG